MDTGYAYDPSHPQSEPTVRSMAPQGQGGSSIAGMLAGLSQGQLSNLAAHLNHQPSPMQAIHPQAIVPPLAQQRPLHSSMPSQPLVQGPLSHPMQSQMPNQLLNPPPQQQQQQQQPIYPATQQPYAPAHQQVQVQQELPLYQQQQQQPSVGMMTHAPSTQMIQPSVHTSPAHPLTIVVPSDATSCVFIDGLPVDITKRELAHIFRPFQGFIGLRTLIKERSNRSNEKVTKVFVNFVDELAATAALQLLYGYKFDLDDPDTIVFRPEFGKPPSQASHQNMLAQWRGPSSRGV